MATRKENTEISELKEEVMEHGFILKKQVLPTLEKVERTLDENMGGIKLAQLLNSRIITVFLGGLVAAGVYFMAKTGGSIGL